MAALTRSAPGVRMGDMRAVQDCAASLQNRDASGALTAKAGGGQTSATQLINGLNHIGTCATSGDSVQLPAAIAGATVYVANVGAQTATVFGKNGRSDTIDATAGATGVSLASTKNAVFFCAVDAKWRMIVTA